MMMPGWDRSRGVAALGAIVAIFLLGPALAAESGLGQIEFATSAKSQEAQAHFERGVAALHSFWYPVALEEFRAASRIEPDFAMAYWGEAMAHNHPVWGDPQNTEAAREVLSRMPAAPSSITAREQAYIDAVRALYGAGEKHERDRAYASAMEKLYHSYPDDVEAAAFYSLALLGLAYGGGSPDSATPRDASALRNRMRAAAVAQEVLRTKPQHPGATHYLIHAFDDPDHAVLALNAARRYADIAPAVPHALHMPSHIFLQLGMWPEAIESNKAAWQASLSSEAPDFHSLHWLLYCLLQQNRASEAEPLLATMREHLAKGSKNSVRDPLYGAYLEATMAATYLIETGRWSEAASVLPGQSASARPGSQQAPATQKTPPPGGGDAGSSRAYAALVRSPVVFARGYAAAMTGTGDVRQAIAALEKIRGQLAQAKIPFAARLAPVLEIQALELSALDSANRGRMDEAIATIRRATQLEEKLPVPPGPPPVIKPSHELAGELLLKAGRKDEAAQAFETSLFRHPGRAASLEGAREARKK
jgi:tetratricopeptide (TPR) repeat protein